MTKPNFFIVGGPKCGTTSISAYLNAHPEIFVAPGEPHYFGTDIQYRDEKLELSEYLELFRAVPKNTGLIGERSTWYLMSRLAAEQIRRFAAGSKIIIAIRNPIDVVASLHHHLAFQTMREDIRDLGKALDAQEDRKLGRRLPARARFPEHFLYTEVATFVPQINRYINEFGWSRVHVVLFDDLVKSPVRTYQALTGFLGADVGYLPKFDVHNPARQTKSRALANALTSTRLRRGMERILPHAVERLVRKMGSSVNNWNMKSVERSPMRPDIQRRLAIHFEEEIVELSDLLGRDLTGWLLQGKNSKFVSKDR